MAAAARMATISAIAPPRMIGDLRGRPVDRDVSSELNTTILQWATHNFGEP
jgi:protein required for attachment to host cells